MKVKLSEVIEALETQHDETRCVYSIKREQVFMLYDGGSDADEAYEKLSEDVENNPDAYIALPDRFDINEYGIMRNFIENLPQGPAQDRLFDAIHGKGAFRRFKDTIRAVGLAGQWYAFRDGELKRIARDWCEFHEITTVDDLAGKATGDEKAKATRPQSTGGGALADILRKRRSRYALNKTLSVPEDAVIALVRNITELVPDAFDMKSARVVCVFGDKQDALWDAVFDAFGGKVARKKIDGFRAAAGTILYYYDEEVVRSLQEKFPPYADNFPIWAEQANGMLQFAVWTALAELGVGANLQHYNPVIDQALARLFDVPASWKLVAQMPFGGIAAEPDPKEKEDVERRVRIAR